MLLLGSLSGCRHAGPTERVVHREDTEHYAIWVIENDAGVRYLRFERDGVDQSAVRLDSPGYLEFTYTQAIVGALSVRPTPERVLIVGLGGGTLPRFLRHHLPTTDIDVVEIDPAVVKVAERHLGFKTDPKMRVHVADGRQFVETATGQWDVVILDAYGADNIPMHLATREFLDAVRQHVRPGGLVIANLWAQRANRHYNAMVKTYLAVFPEVHVIKAWQSLSRILIAFPEPEGLTHATLGDAVRALEARWSLSVDLGRIIDAGYVAPSELAEPAAEALVDP